MPGPEPRLEERAAAVVARVLGGSYNIVDTGSAPRQYDARITTPEGRAVALEVTSFGGDHWKTTAAGIDTSHRKRVGGSDLSYTWSVSIPTGTRIRSIEKPLVALLQRLEQSRKVQAGVGYKGDDEVLREAAVALEDLGVNSVGVWHTSPPPDQTRIVFSQSKRWVSTSESIPNALAALFEKRDNQAKLARARAEERHLYVLIEDEAAAGRFQSTAPLPLCPADPEGVIDALWVASLFVPQHVYQVQPGTASWHGFDAATGVRLTADHTDGT